MTPGSTRKNLMTYIGLSNTDNILIILSYHLANICIDSPVDTLHNT